MSPQPQKRTNHQEMTDMYKCRLVYDEWKSIIKKTRIGVYENSDSFQGYVGVLVMDEVSELQTWSYKDTNITVCDIGYRWLTILPEDEYY